MDKLIKGQFTPAVRNALFERFGVGSKDWKECDGYESFIYDCITTDGARIIRISHDSRRNKNYIQGELDWLRYLGKHHLRVGEPCPSLNGTYLESFRTDEGTFFAVSFKKMPGSFASKADWNDKLFYKMGVFTGKMHNLSKTYSPQKPQFRRPHWYEETGDFARKYLTDPTDGKIIEAFDAVQAKLHSLPTGPEDYGLVHFDFHSGNFFVHEGEIYLFDFDDCQYCWYAADIAIAFYYALPLRLITEGDKTYARNFFHQFHAGYTSVAPFKSEWLKVIPLFLKYREIDLYICIKRSFTEDEYEHWDREFMAGRKEAIEANRPFLPFSIVNELH